MASFDIVSKIDQQTLDNTVNSVKREIGNRYDFRGSNSEVELDKKTKIIHITSEHELKMEQIEKIIIERMVKNKLDPKFLDFGEERVASGKVLKKEVIVKAGIDKETAKKIVKAIKGMKAKVQPQIMDEQVRVTSKKIDDLQAVIAMCKGEDFDVPLQFVNMK